MARKQSKLKKYDPAKRVRRKRNFLIHLMIYLSMGIFFFLLNVFTLNPFDGWWFMFPMLPLSLILFFHYIFTIGKDHLETLAIRWEENETGITLDNKILELHSGDEYDDELDLEDYRKKDVTFRESGYDQDFV